MWMFIFLSCAIILLVFAGISPQVGKAPFVRATGGVTSVGAASSRLAYVSARLQALLLEVGRAESSGLLLASPSVVPADAFPTRPLQPATEAYLARWPHCAGAAPGPLATVVSSMVVLPRAKHSLETYLTWLSTTLSSVAAPLVLYLGNFPGGEDRIRELRGDQPLRVVHVADTWGLPRAAELRKEYEGRQFSIDLEQKIHSPELYAIWNGKVDMLAAVAAENPYCSRYFLWADAGTFRDRLVPGWPAEDRVEAAFAGRPEDGMLFSLIGVDADGWQGFLAHAAAMGSYAAIANETRWDTNIPWAASHLLQGGFLGGSARAVEAFAEEFHAHLDHQVAHGRFIGKDQISFSMLFERTLLPGSPTQGRHAAVRATQNCGDLWFYYIAFFAPTDALWCNLHGEGPLSGPLPGHPS